MENVDAFIGNGGSAFWEYLVFKHNQHQIEEARLLSKKLGFKKFSHSFDTLLEWSITNVSPLEWDVCFSVKLHLTRQSFTQCPPVFCTCKKTEFFNARAMFPP